MPCADSLPPLWMRGGMATLDAVQALNARAQALLDRATGAPGPTPHGFRDPAGFVASCRRRDARNRAFRIVKRRLLESEIRRGRFVAWDHPDQLAHPGVRLFALAGDC